jgi:hypothetical protein
MIPLRASLHSHLPIRAAQHLAAADPAGVRKVGDAVPARVRENEWTVARAAGQLPLASSGSDGDAPQCCADPLRGRFAELEAVRRRDHMANPSMFRSLK